MRVLPVTSAVRAPLACVSAASSRRTQSLRSPQSLRQSTRSLTGGRPAPRLLGQRPAYGLNQTTRQSKLMLNCLLNMVFGGSNNDDVKNIKSFHELKALDIDKQEVDFSSFKGQAVLVVNVASK
mmetsp:Transcript_5994/g.10810  ORF Transcript_5994/g.10810 Transcript_5994/m.10810 type:complete len:124 (-) Transcript_5994:782-1153(-)